MANVHSNSDKPVHDDTFTTDDEHYADAEKNRGDAADKKYNPPVIVVHCHNAHPHDDCIVISNLDQNPTRIHVQQTKNCVARILTFEHQRNASQLCVSVSTGICIHDR